jgi:hypothetical protein
MAAVVEERAWIAEPADRPPSHPASGGGSSGSGSPTASWPTCGASTEADVRAARLGAGVRATFKTVDTCGAEFEAETPYHYSTYEDDDEVRPSSRRRIDPRLGPQPHRPGHRVRLLLRARQLRPARRRLRDRDGQLQPGDGVDRLRHVRSPLLRAAHARGRAQRHRRRAARRRRRVARRPDAAQAGRPHPARPRAGTSPSRSTGRGPRALERAVRRAQDPPSRRRRGRQRARGAGRGRADRVPGARAPSYVLGGRAMRIVDDRAS